MKNKFNNYSVLLILIITFILVFTYPKEITYSVLYSINLWKNNIVPTTFTLFVISDLLIEYGLLNLINKILNNKVNGNIITIFMLSLLSGFPSSAKYTKKFLEEDKITIEEANYIIMFCNFSNPLFIISTIGINYLNNVKYGYIILISHIISNIIIGIYYKRKITKRKIITKKQESNKKEFITILTSSINDTFKILINILGIITVFMIISLLIEKVLKKNIITIIIKSVLEMTQGTLLISKSNIYYKLKVSLIGALISFNGISIHMQIKSILDNTKIKYSNYLKGRIIQSIICFILIYIFI